jgi:hypothetical protein
MKKYYIQFSTDFHLLASLASIDDLSDSHVILVGPHTRMAVLLAEKISAEFVVADPRCAPLKLRDILPLLTRSQRCTERVIVSPFVFPSYVFLRLLEEGWMVTNIIRTDEGVGSYASIGHYYNSLKLESVQKGKLHCATKAFVKKTSVWLTKFLRICREKYIFKKDLDVNQRRVERLRTNIELLGLRDELNGKMVYISQPGVSASFESTEKYVSFLKKLVEEVGLGNAVIKRHPSDRFDYTAFGFEVVEGYPLELYRLQNSVVVGFSSTALLMAKIVSGCSKVYYIKVKGAGPFYDGLSPMNKRLFDRYLAPLDCVP